MGAPAATEESAEETASDADDVSLVSKRGRLLTRRRGRAG